MIRTSSEDRRLLDGDSESENGSRCTSTACHTCGRQSRYILGLLMGLVISLGLNMLMSVLYIQEDTIKIQHVPDISPFGMQGQKH